VGLLLGFMSAITESTQAQHSKFYVAFSRRITSDEDEYLDSVKIIIAASDGTTSQQLTNSGFILHERYPQWSQDGMQIAYLYYSPSVAQLRLYNLETDEVTVLADHLAQSIRWSPDERYISLSQYQGRYELSIYDMQQATLSFLIEGQPGEWSPDSEFLAVNVGTLEHRDIAIIRPDGTGYRLLTNDEYGNASPRWSPDGQYVYFLSNRTGNWDIYRIDIDGTNLMSLTQTEEDEASLLPSPDGRLIAYTVHYGHPSLNPRPKLLFMDSNGSDVTEVLPAGLYYGFQWLPDSSGLVFYMQTEAPDYEPPVYMLAWLDLACMDRGCSSDDIQLIPNTEVIGDTYPFDVYMP
jgi:Tol biopolymer transport system component